MVFNDFIEQPPYGIEWWTPGVGASRRILIGDQLYACLDSVSTNMWSSPSCTGSNIRIAPSAI
jgi:hypothetical protein